MLCQSAEYIFQMCWQTFFVPLSLPFCTHNESNIVFLCLKKEDSLTVKPPTNKFIIIKLTQMASVKESPKT